LNQSLIIAEINMGVQKELKASLLLAMICMSTISSTLAAPNARKFAVKSNSPKKVYHKTVAPAKELGDRTERERDQSSAGPAVRLFPKTEFTDSVEL
jgi:hypothetical protein